MPKLSHEDFMRRIEEQERALREEDARREKVRGIDIDDGYGL